MTPLSLGKKIAMKVITDTSVAKEMGEMESGSCPFIVAYHIQHSLCQFFLFPAV